MQRATIISITFKSCNALLRTLLVRIRSYTESVRRYKFLISDIYHEVTLYVNKDARIRGYFSKAKAVPEQASLGNTDLVH